MDRWADVANLLEQYLNSCSSQAMQRHNLTLGQQAFLRDLRELTERKQELVRDARVAVKRNAAGDLVFAVIVPAVRLPEGTA